MQERSIDKIKLINYELRIVYKTDSIEFYFFFKIKITISRNYLKSTYVACFEHWLFAGQTPSTCPTFSVE